MLAAGRAKVELAPVGADDLDRLAGLGDVDEVFQFPRASVQPFGLGHDHDVDLARLDCSEHLTKLSRGLVERREMLMLLSTKARVINQPRSAAYSRHSAVWISQLSLLPTSSLLILA